MSEFSKHYTGTLPQKSRWRAGAGWLLFFVVLGILLRLAWWQYQRGLEKADFEDHLSQTALDTPISENEARASGWPEWQTVFLKGRMRATAPVILDNRTRSGQAGYETLVVWVGSDGVHYLLNQGWQPFPKGERKVQPADSVSGHVVARLHHPSDYEVTRLPKPQAGQPWFLPGLNLGAVQQKLAPDAQWAPVVLLQELPASSTGRQRDWHRAIGGMPAARHFGYAVQWALLALAWTWLFTRLWYKDLRRRTPSS
jgi:cytochrome oxidase assembly protein ShyY1